MKYLIFSIILLAMFACNPDGSIGTPATSVSADSTFAKLNANYSDFKYYAIKVIDGCEYIVYKDNHSNLNIEHKGNCKNPIHYQVKHDTLYVLKESGVVLQKQLRK